MTTGRVCAASTRCTFCFALTRVRIHMYVCIRRGVHEKTMDSALLSWNANKPRKKEEEEEEEFMRLLPYRIHERVYPYDMFKIDVTNET